MAPRKKPLPSSEDRLISQRTAQRLIREPEFISSLDELENAYLTQWAATRPQEQEKREVAYYGLKAVRDVRARLERLASAAVVRDKQEQIEHERGPKCPSCGAGVGEQHGEGCSILAANLARLNAMTGKPNA